MYCGLLYNQKCVSVTWKSLVVCWKTAAVSVFLSTPCFDDDDESMIYCSTIPRFHIKNIKKIQLAAGHKIINQSN